MTSVADEKTLGFVTLTSVSPDEKSTKVANRMATIHDDDERLLAQIGYTQVSDTSPR
jgi:hypothetical protein